MRFPYEDKLFKKHALVYITIQVVLWLKVALFYYLYGQGILLRLIEPTYTFAPLLMPEVFTSNLLIIDWLFHQLIHLSLGVMVFLFARRVKALNLGQLFSIVLVADVLHNFGYWLTNSFTSTTSLVLDFVDDFALFVIFYYLFRFLCAKYKWFGKLLPKSW